MGSPRSYNLKEDYFDVVDTPSKAYLLGFIYADGSIWCSKNQTIIQLISPLTFIS